MSSQHVLEVKDVVGPCEHDDKNVSLRGQNFNISDIQKPQLGWRDGSWLKLLTATSEDLGSISSTRLEAHNCL